MAWTLFWRSARSQTARFSRPFSTSLARHDQWPLPHTPEHIAATSNSNPAQPRPRGHEELDVLRARLTYQSRKRGILETDLLLATFARDHLGTMSRTELEEYDKLLDEADWDIYYWTTGDRPAPDHWANAHILERLRAHASNQGKEIRVMPPLRSRPQ